MTRRAGTPAPGFEAGDDVVAARRREDEAALAALAARPTWLDFPTRSTARSPHGPSWRMRWVRR